MKHTKHSQFILSISSTMNHPNLYFLLFFVYVSVSNLLSLHHVTSLTHDAEILLDVKRSRIGDPYNNLNNWAPSSEAPCNWKGITCNPQSFAVISINLTEFFIISQGFPGDFCRISTLQNLSFFNNSIRGRLSSEEFSLCSHLYSLDLSFNQLEGSLPDFTVEFTNLFWLDLSFNHFSGEVPPSFGRFPKLQFLNFTANNVSISPYLGNLTELRELNLHYNPAPPGLIPNEIGNLAKLEYLCFSSCNLIGEIPDSIEGLVSMKYLDLSRNALSGKIPSTIGHLKNVIKISFYQNRLSGELPESLENLINMFSIDVSSNNLTGKWPERFAALQLHTLHLNDNHFTGEIPATLALNAKLVELKVFNNSFSGSLPKDLGRNNSVLEEVDVSTNHLHGELPPFLCAGNKLRRLITFNNRMTGNIPKNIANCRNLAYVRIEYNKFTGRIPDSFWGHPGLYHLNVRNNRFEGSIPPSVSPALKTLRICSNNFSSVFPAEICKLRKLIEIRANGNQFSGELPACITELKNLEYLNLKQNMFSGRIPSKVSSWVHLTELNLARNRFSGEIPSELGDLRVLDYLDLSDNLLSGEIPKELTKLRLNIFNLSNNHLIGRIPAGFEADFYEADFYVPNLMGNPNLCTPNLKPFPPCPNSKAAKWFVTLIVAIVFSILLTVLVWYFKSKTKKNVRGGKSKSPWKVTSFHRMGIDEDEIMSSMTDKNLIGTGGSGKVYRASLKNGQTVAVKKLWRGSGNPETEKVYQSEVETLGKIRHGNIVKLWCSCIAENFRVLVYEYMKNGSLADVLHGEKGGILLNWPRRFSIAIGAAKGLSYLHHDCVPTIVHRDVKSSNILLDEQFHPRVADFGLARILQSDDQEDGRNMSLVAGSYGYIAPEYGYTLKVTVKSDVYSFGVVLMELVTGKRAIDPSFKENEDIVKWVTDVVTSKGHWFKNMNLQKISDPRLNASSSDYDQMEMVMNVAMLCTSESPSNRPSMRRVVDLLQLRKDGSSPAIFQN